MFFKPISYKFKNTIRHLGRKFGNLHKSIALSLYLLANYPIPVQKVKHEYRREGKSFEKYLKEHNISTEIIDNLDSEGVQLISEVGERRRFYELIASNGVLLQTLIPLGEGARATPL